MLGLSLELPALTPQDLCLFCKFLRGLWLLRVGGPARSNRVCCLPLGSYVAVCSVFLRSTTMLLHEPKRVVPRRAMLRSVEVSNY